QTLEAIRRLHFDRGQVIRQSLTNRIDLRNVCACYADITWRELTAESAVDNIRSSLKKANYRRSYGFRHLLIDLTRNASRKLDVENALTVFGSVNNPVNISSA